MSDPVREFQQRLRAERDQADKDMRAQAISDRHRLTLMRSLADQYVAGAADLSSDHARIFLNVAIDIYRVLDGKYES